MLLAILFVISHGIHDHVVSPFVPLVLSSCHQVLLMASLPFVDLWMKGPCLR